MALIIVPPHTTHNLMQKPAKTCNPTSITTCNHTQVFEFPSTTSAKVLLLGKTANLKVFPNKTANAYLTLKFNRIEELDVAGNAVFGHAITSLSGLTPSYSAGAHWDAAGPRRQREPIGKLPPLTAGTWWEAVTANSGNLAGSCN